MVTSFENGMAFMLFPPSSFGMDTYTLKPRFQDNLVWLAAVSTQR